MLLNVIFNAREAMDEEGTLAVETRNVYLEALPGSGFREMSGEYVRLAVRDDGPGIAPEIRDRIFDAFFTTKGRAKKPGTGLGLSIVQAIVEDHNGHIEIDSEVGEGTSFVVYLPASRDSSDPTPAGQSSEGSETVLVVDDDPFQREVLKGILETLGYHVRLAASGEDAVRMLVEAPADLLILDMIMAPGIDGAETYRRVLKARPEQRAIIVSGYAESDRVMEMQSLGAGGFLRKPVTFDGLRRAVRRELERGRPAAGSPEKRQIAPSETGRV